MGSPLDQVNINLNQNLWGMIVGLGSLGIADYYRLCTLFWFSCAVTTIMLISIGFTTYAYTKNYCAQKQPSSGQGTK